MPSVPAVARDRRPSGLARRIASARPGASRSSTCEVPSGVRSRGPKPVPPVVTIKPGETVGQLRDHGRDRLDPVGDDPALDHLVPCGLEALGDRRARASSRTPATTPSETVQTLACSRTAGARRACASGGRAPGRSSGPARQPPTRPRGSRRTASAGSGEWKTAEPATKQRRPGERGHRGGLLVDAAVHLEGDTEALALGLGPRLGELRERSGMNDWLPKPGCTVMINNRSTRPR